MRVNIKELLKSTGIDLQIYPGKKLVVQYQQPGEFKSHNVAIDWRSDNLRVELNAGLTGKKLEPKDLQKYPVSFQAPTYFELNVNDDEDETDEEEEEGSKGKSGGGRKPTEEEQLLEDDEPSLMAFDKATDGRVPEEGKIEKFVVMGKELAQEAFAQAYKNFKEQLSQTKVMAMDIMKNIDDTIKKVAPGGGLEAKGNETVNYKYDIEKNSPLFGGMAPS